MCVRLRMERELGSTATIIRLLRINISNGLASVCFPRSPIRPEDGDGSGFRNVAGSVRFETVGN
jgi:hypothetical protein